MGVSLIPPPGEVKVEGRSVAIAVACSGGRDSTALLHACARWAALHGGVVHALHVHHGLNAAADEWLAHLKRQCRTWARRLPVHFHHRKLQGTPRPGESVEAWARAGRYAALAEMARAAGCELVLLGHHRRDQAETFLLQSLRGAGPAGLAGMPHQITRDGLTWGRPWLHASSHRIDSYVARWRLKHIEDSSNQDARFDRNRLRIQIWPKLLAAFPDAEASLCAAAHNAHRAASLAREMAELDLSAATVGDRLKVEVLCSLSESRRWFAVQAWLKRVHDKHVPDRWVQSICESLESSKRGNWTGPGHCAVSLHRGELWYRPTVGAQPSHVTGACSSQLPTGYEHAIGTFCEPARIEVPPFCGALEFSHATSKGVPWPLLQGAFLTLRWPDDQFQLHQHGVARSLKKQFQTVGVPSWLRDGPCLRRRDEQGRLHLLWVCGLGVDARVATDRGAAIGWVSLSSPEQLGQKG